MINHVDMGAKEVRSKIRHKEICFAGNKKLKIYGTLRCRHGIRMKIENRVFFRSEGEAIGNDFRPCGHCIKRKST